jgi:hypothetical protein
MKNVQEFRSSAARVVPLARFAGKSLFLSVMKLFINAKILLVVTYWSLLHNSQTIDKKMNLCGGFATMPGRFPNPLLTLSGAHLPRAYGRRFRRFPENRRTLPAKA